MAPSSTLSRTDNSIGHLAVQAGDNFVRRLPGGETYRAIVLSDGIEEAASLIGRGTPVESSGPGGYVEVAEFHDAGGHRIGRRIADAGGHLLPGHNLISATAEAADGENLGEEFPPRNQYPSVMIRGRGRSRVAVVDMRRLGTKSVSRLGRLFHLRIEQVMRALVRRRANAHVVPELHAQTAFSWNGLAQARRDLRDARPTVYYMGQTLGNPRGNFRVPGGLRNPIVLPITSGFERDFAAYQAWLERERRRGLLRAPLRAVLDQVGSIRIHNQILKSNNDSVRDLISPRLRDLSLLQSLSLMTATMVRFPKSTPDADDARGIATFQRHLREVTTAANDVMLTRPVGYEWWTANIRETSGALLRLLGDSTLARNMAVVARHWDLVDATDRTRIEQSFLESYRLLVASPRAEEAIRHLQPVLEALAADFTAPSSIPPTLSSGFRTALTLRLPQSTGQTALGYLALAAGIGSRTVANLPGPNAFAVALLNVIGPTLMTTIARSDDAGRLGGLVYRALVAVTRLEASEANTLLQHVARGNHQGMADARSLITRKWPGRSAGGFLVLLNIAAMLNVWVSNEQLTLRNWTDLISSGIGATLGATRILVTLDRLEDARVLSSLARGAGGKALGLLGGALAIYSGTELAIAEYRSGDITGALLAGGEVAGGTVSVVGFLMAAGAANSWNGVGEVLMLIGALVGLVSFIWSSLRDYFTSGPKKVAEGMLGQFRRRGGAYDLLRMTQGDMPDESRRRVRQLQAKVDALVEKFNDANFWNISLDGAETLLDLDFYPAHIAVLTNEDEDDVIRRLRRENRWTSKDRRRFRQQGQSSSDAIGVESVEVSEASANRKLRPHEVRYLVLEGGGGKGLVFLGALRGLEQVPAGGGQSILAVANNRLSRIRGVAGSSAGAITALGLSCGMNAAAIDRISNPALQDFDEFFDLPERVRKVHSIGSNCVAARTQGALRTLVFDPMELLLRRALPLVSPAMIPFASRVSQSAVNQLEQSLHQSAVQGLQRGDGLVAKLASPAMLYYARNLWQDLGFFSGCIVRAFLNQVIVRQGGRPNMTFADHRRTFGVKLVVTGSNLESGHTELFSADHTPQMPVADAVRISMSLPVLFKPVRITMRKAQEITRGATLRTRGGYAGLWVDGGLWNNLPMTVFTNDEGNTPGTLGLALGDTALTRSRIANLGQFLGALMEKFTGDVALANAYPSYRQQIIALDTGDIGTAEFSPNAQRLQQLQAAAANTTVQYFQSQ